MISLTTEMLRVNVPDPLNESHNTGFTDGLRFITFGELEGPSNIQLSCNQTGRRTH